MRTPCGGPDSERYPAEDDRWRRQQLDLFTALRREVGGVRREQAIVAGEKGTAEAIILALTSAGSVTAALQCLRDWLARDRTRVIEIVHHEEGHEEKIAVRASNVGDEVFGRLTDLALARWRNEP